MILPDEEDDALEDENAPTYEELIMMMRVEFGDDYSEHLELLVERKIRDAVEESYDRALRQGYSAGEMAKIFERTAEWQKAASYLATHLGDSITAGAVLAEADIWNIYGAPFDTGF